MSDFKVGDGVTINDGVMKHNFGTIVYFHKEKQQYLVRFGEAQQLYFNGDQLMLWEDYLTSRKSKKRE